MSLACLDTLIGLASKAPCCFTDKKPDGFNVSDTGYFLLDPDFGVPSLGECQLPGWGMLQRGLDSAKIDLRTELGASMLNEYKSALAPFSGMIGQLKFAGGTTPNGDFIGITLIPKRQRGVKLVLKKIFQGLDTSGDYTFHVTSNDPTFTAPAPVTGTLVGGQFSSVVFSAELPFWSDAIDDLEYYITVERNGAYPLYNMFSCCGNTPAWMQHVEAAGFEFSDASGSNANGVAGANGMVLEAYLTCDTLGWICNLPELNGWETYSVLGRTLQFRGSSHVITEMIDTNFINICNLYTLEQWQAKRNWYNKRFAENIQWVSQNVPSGATDCFTCKDEDLIFKTYLTS